jgi:hypothetical protein
MIKWVLAISLILNIVLIFLLIKAQEASVYERLIIETHGDN